VGQPELASGARAIKEGSIKKYLNMVNVRSVAFVQLFFCFKQAVFNLVFSYMFIDLGTEDPKSHHKLLVYDLFFFKRKSAATRIR
jgi:hypothetical protein